MTSRIRSLTLPILLVAGNVAAAPDVRSLPEAIAEGKADLSFRYRLETVDQDGIAKSAAASTLRTRLGWRSARLEGWDALIEMDDVSYLGNDNFNNLRNGKASYPVVADPNGTGINQLNVRYLDGPAEVVIGRQRINVDNQRFIGGVGWRQNEQTYDALSAIWSADGYSATYRYLDRVSRIFGPEDGSPDKSLDSDSHLIHGTANLGDGEIAGYAWLLDFDNAAALSSNTLGVRYDVEFEIDDWRLPLHVEYARQRDGGDNPADYSANYVHTSIGATAGAISATLGFEVLGADDDAGVAFATPLATLHKFNGWADKFLGTPGSGLEDRYLGGSYETGIGKFAATWHDFEADSGGADYGSEIDVSWSTSVGEHLGVLAKAARYDADAFATDTTKVWVMLTASF